MNQGTPKTIEEVADRMLKAGNPERAKAILVDYLNNKFSSFFLESKNESVIRLYRHITKRSAA